MQYKICPNYIYLYSETYVPMSRKVLFATLASLLCVLLTLNAAPREWTIQTIPNVQKADRTQLVTNPDEVLSSSAVDSLNALLVPLKEQGLAEVAVVAVKEEPPLPMSI